MASKTEVAEKKEPASQPPCKLHGGSPPEILIPRKYGPRHAAGFLKHARPLITTGSNVIRSNVATVMAITSSSSPPRRKAPAHLLPRDPRRVLQHPRALR